MVQVGSTTALSSVSFFSIQLDEVAPVLFGFFPTMKAWLFFHAAHHLGISAQVAGLARRGRRKEASAAPLLGSQAHWIEGRHLRLQKRPRLFCCCCFPFVDQINRRAGLPLKQNARQNAKQNPRGSQASGFIGILPQFQDSCTRVWRPSNVCVPIPPLQESSCQTIKSRPAHKVSISKDQLLGVEVLQIRQHAHTHTHTIWITEIYCPCPWKLHGANGAKRHGYSYTP